MQCGVKSSINVYNPTRATEYNYQQEAWHRQTSSSVLLSRVINYSFGCYQLACSLLVSWQEYLFPVLPSLWPYIVLVWSWVLTVPEGITLARIILIEWPSVPTIESMISITTKSSCATGKKWSSTPSDSDPWTRYGFLEIYLRVCPPLYKEFVKFFVRIVFTKIS